mmetsp:Transcript_93691/g.252570  ORF Transcript_93691/g.252570 Transcript_93691/m.252570 type:complete len:641 (+) Transcript_93691:137-2059(+)
MSFVLFACIPSSCEDAEGAAKLVAAVFARCGGGGGTSGETQQTSGKPPFCHAQPQQQQQQELQLLQQLQPGRQCSPWPCGEATAGLAAASCAAGAAPAGSHRKLCSGAGCGTCAEVSADFEQRLRRGAPCCEIQDTQKESVAWPFAAACCDFLQAAGEFPGQAPCGTAGSEVKGEAEQSSSAQSPQEQHEQEQNGDEVYLTPQAPSGTGDSTRCGTASKEVQNEVAPQESEPAAEIFTETGSAAKAIPAIQASHALPGGTALHRPHQGGEAEGEQEAAQFVVVVNECLSHSLLEVTVEEDLHRHEDAAEREFGEQQAGAARGKGKGRRARAGLSAKAFDGTGATHRGFSSSGRGACAGRCSAISAGSSHGGPPGDPGVAEDCGAANGETAAVRPAALLLGSDRRMQHKTRGSCDALGGEQDAHSSARKTWGYTGDRWHPQAEARTEITDFGKLQAEARPVIPDFGKSQARPGNTAEYMKLQSEVNFVEGQCNVVADNEEHAHVGSYDAHADEEDYDAARHEHYHVEEGDYWPGWFEYESQEQPEQEAEEEQYNDPEESGGACSSGTTGGSEDSLEKQLAGAQDRLQMLRAMAAAGMDGQVDSATSHSQQAAKCNAMCRVADGILAQARQAQQARSENARL